MKKIYLTIALVASVLGASAQNRKHVANFSLFQQYFNPALTGYETHDADGSYLPPDDKPVLRAPRA